MHGCIYRRREVSQSEQPGDLGAVLLNLLSLVMHVQQVSVGLLGWAST